MSELNKLEKYIISKKDKIQISSKEIKVGDISVSYTHLTLPTTPRV